MENRDPGPPGLFETRVYGPFLILRTREPVKTEDAYLAAAARVMLVGRSLGIGDADVNMQTVELADRSAPRLRAVAPPPLRHLAVAGRALERAEARRRLAASPGRAQTARGGRGGRSDQPADHERPHLAAAPGGAIALVVASRH